MCVCSQILRRRHYLLSSNFLARLMYRLVFSLSGGNSAPRAAVAWPNRSNMNIAGIADISNPCTRGILFRKIFKYGSVTGKQMHISWWLNQCGYDKIKKKSSNASAKSTVPVIIGFSMGNCFTTFGKNDKASLAKITFEYRPTVVIAPCDNVPVSKGSPGNTEAIIWADALSLLLRPL